MPYEMMPDDQTMSPQIDVHDYLKKKYGLGEYSPQAREQLVQDVQDSGSPLAAALSGFGAGIAGRDVGSAFKNVMDASQAGAKEQLNAFDTARKNSIEDTVNEKIANQDDPNSDASKRFRDTLKANFPTIASAYGDNFDNLTASDSKNIFQIAETKAKLTQAQALKDAVYSKKENDQIEKDYKDLNKALSGGWTARSGNAGRVQQLINSGEAAKALIEQGKNQEGGLDSRQMEELAQSVGKMLGGNATASARIEGLVPHTLMGRAQSLKEFLSGNPQGQEQQAFVKRLEETVDREMELANDQKKQFQVEAAGAYSALKNKDPERYNQSLQSHGISLDDIDDKGRYVGRNKKISSDLSSNQVKIIAPNGKIKLVPKSDLEELLAAGAKLVDTPSVAGEIK